MACNNSNSSRASPKNTGPSNGSCDIGNPINPGIANKWQREVDVSLHSLGFDRFYNANNTTDTAHLGANWTHRYSSAITLLATGVEISRPDGKRYLFTNNAGNYVPDADVLGQLVAIPTGGWRYTGEDNSEEIYDATGHLLSISAADGHWQTLSYSTATTPTTVAPAVGLLIGVSDDSGRSLSFVYDASSRISQLTAGGQVYQYAYDANGNLASVTYPDATPTVLTDNPKKTYVYSELAYTANVSLPNALTGIVDENGKRYATFQYDATGRAIATEHAGGVDKYQLGYTSDANGNPLSATVTDPLGTHYGINFQTILGVVKSTGQTQPAGSGCSAAASALTYDGNGNVSSRKDFNGHSTCYAYDIGRNLETSRLEGLAAGKACPASVAGYAPAANSVERKITTTWHPTFRLPTQRAEPQKLTTWVYNGQPDPANNNVIANCAPAAATLPDGKPIAVLCKKTEQATTDLTGASGLAATLTGTPRSWAFTYNANGQVLTADGPRTDVSDVTRYAYYATNTASYQASDLQSVTNGVGHVTTVSAYNASGQPLIIVNPNNTTTTLAYTPRGGLKSTTVSPPTGSTLPALTTSYVYYPTGLLNTVTLPDASVLTYGYDDAHRLTSIKDSLGNSVTYLLDNAGNRKNEAYKDSTGVLKRNIDRVYDALNRLQTVTGDVQ